MKLPQRMSGERSEAGETLIVEAVAVDALAEALHGFVLLVDPLGEARLATAFIGLAFHHHRRMQELEHLRRQITGTTTHTPASS